MLAENVWNKKNKAFASDIILYIFVYVYIYI